MNHQTKPNHHGDLRPIQGRLAGKAPVNWVHPMAYEPAPKPQPVQARVARPVQVEISRPSGWAQLREIVIRWFNPKRTCVPFSATVEDGYVTLPNGEPGKVATVRAFGISIKLGLDHMTGRVRVESVSDGSTSSVLLMHESAVTMNVGIVPPLVIKRKN